MHCAPGTHPSLHPAWRAHSQSFPASSFPLESCAAPLSPLSLPKWLWIWPQTFLGLLVVIFMYLHRSSKWEKEKALNFKHYNCVSLSSWFCLFQNLQYACLCASTCLTWPLLHHQSRHLLSPVLCMPGSQSSCDCDYWPLVADLHVCSSHLSMRG